MGDSILHLPGLGSKKSGKTLGWQGNCGNLTCLHERPKEGSLFLREVNMLHTISSCIRALFVSVIIYLVLFTFVPALSNPYLGVSLSSLRHPVEKNLLDEMQSDGMQEALSQAVSAEDVEKVVVGAMEKAGSYTTNEIQQAKKLLANPEFAEEIKKAAKRGGIAFSQKLRAMLETAR